MVYSAFDDLHLRHAKAPEAGQLCRRMCARALIVSRIERSLSRHGADRVGFLFLWSTREQGERGWGPVHKERVAELSSSPRRTQRTRRKNPVLNRFEPPILRVPRGGEVIWKRTQREKR